MVQGSVENGKSEGWEKARNEEEIKEEKIKTGKMRI